MSWGKRFQNMAFRTDGVDISHRLEVVENFLVIKDYWNGQALQSELDTALRFIDGRFPQCNTSVEMFFQSLKFEDEDRAIA